MSSAQERIRRLGVKRLTRSSLGSFLKGISQDYSTILGFAAWSAGSFDANYTLSLTPTNGVDNELFDIAVKPYLPGHGH